MNNSIVGKIKINTFDDLVGGEQPEITELPIKDLHTFRDHPFKVLDDEKMEETVQSIKENGVLMPGIVRPRSEGGYEIIAGHRRKRACELAGLETMPVLIREYTDDEAIIAMVDTNLQREGILPSEKAHAYSMKFEVMKHQGVRGGNTLQEIADSSGEGIKTVQRYICLSHLTEGLLTMVDEKKLPIRSGVEISYLSVKEQEWVERILIETSVQMSPKQAERIRKNSADNTLTRSLIFEILTQKKHKSRKFVIRDSMLMKYFSDDASDEEIEETIIGLLDEWIKNRR